MDSRPLVFYRDIFRAQFPLLLLWTTLVWSSFFFNMQALEKQVQGQAYRDATLHFEKDLATRQWLSSHGGIYVPPSKTTPPNPYLAHIENRDIVTSAGDSLTLMNPAYAFRQMTDLAKTEDVWGHLTSLEPLNPENAPDEWETSALNIFRQNPTSKEIAAVVNMSGSKYLRVIRPMVAEKSCLKCHQDQGYTLGDLRGGISASIAMQPYIDSANVLHQRLMATQLILFLLGVAAISVLGYRKKQSTINRKRNEEQARLQKERLEFAVSGVGDCAWDLDLSSETITRVGQLAANLGMPNHPDGIYKWKSRVHPDDLPHAALILQQQINGETNNSIVTYRVQDIHGNWRTIQDRSLVADRDLNGRTTRIIGIMRDVSDLEEAAQERDDLQHQLQQSQKMEAIGTLAGGVAHDFNNLLTVINGYSELLLARIEDNSPLREDLNTILSSGKRANALTRQLLAFSRSQSIVAHPVKINDVILNLNKMLTRLIPASIHIETDLNNGLPLIMADPSQVEQILINLVVNARDAIHALPPEAETRTIQIKTTQVTLKKNQHHISPLLKAGEYLHLTIRDTGVGISKELVDRIFEPFFTTKQVGEGTGLGLATIYGILTQNKGGIHVDSTLGKGTCFNVFWPLSDGSKDHPSSTSTPSDFRGGSETILLVEDDQMVSNLGKTMLEKLGYEVHTASNASEANTLLGELFSVDLLFTDLALPDQNGTLLAKSLLENHKTKAVLLTTGSSDESLNLSQSQLEHLLMKPYTMKNLAGAVRKALDSASGYGNKR